MFQKRSNSFWWCVAVSVLILGLVSGLISSGKLRTIWQLVDAGTTNTRPALDLRMLLVEFDCYRQAGFHWDEALVRQAAVQEGGSLCNYPAGWLLLAYVPGLSVRHTLLFAAVLYILFGITLAFLFRKESVPTQLLIFLALLSPCVVLLCERANSDILMFCLVSWAALLLVRGRVGDEIAATCLFLVAALLKLYPIAAAICLFANPSRRKLVLFVLCMTFFVLGALESDLARVRADTPVATSNAFGAKVVTDEILGKVNLQRHANALVQFRQQLQKRGDYNRLVTVSEAASQLCALLFACACGLLGMRACALVEKAATLTLRQRTLFLAGAAIYVASFIGNNNWSYRLVFLILCIPGLVSLNHASTASPVRWLFASLLCAILLVLWLTAIYEPLEYFLIHNLLHWFAVCGLSFVSGGILRSSLLEGFHTADLDRIPRFAGKTAFFGQTYRG